MGWGSFGYEGAVCDLAHLDPFTITVTPKALGAPTWSILVSFGHHTFTREVLPTDPPAHLYTVDTDVRCFCPTRFGQSANLPGIIASAATGKAYLSEGYNYLLIESLPGLVGPYAVFFNVEKAKSLSNVHVVMRVVSAYEKPGLPPKSRLQAITMATLISKTMGFAPVVRRRKKRRKK